ncbi:cation diffusion facilitator CzcD-associated flavoprotein CzcO [Kitasatospora sp. GAS204A]|uniref:flavin-containing monooxygenase n=1 Tax=unclassified Kitasatospora TaxID=2633591 RepID=UPI0024764784|nr:NAD(P)/FAD-dependent oxidoreductase [Kitasatospora sp. GAS204B]MDH6122317.1 cation diffusion facilitator CzcD-associated flavoprotein CzcO [Kitasatospora sp. GAS204B]
MIPAQATRPSERVDAVVVGAGFSGIGAAIRLRQAGFRNVLVLEKASQLGGTWRENTYPGCACDVPSTLYSYSFAPDTAWSRIFAGQREIHAYLRATAERHRIDEVLRCGVEVRGARWDPAAGCWRLETSDGPYSAAVLVLATGPWHLPRELDVPGVEEFDGPVLHTARWDESIDLTGRRVAVVGSGASAVQLVPAIADRAAAVHLFQRTAQWVLPKPDLPVPAAVNRLLDRLPGARRALRAGQYALQEGFNYAFRHPRLARLLEVGARAQLQLAVGDPWLRRALTPDYRLGCKRLLTSSTFYRALAQPHVRLHPTAVAAVHGNEIVGADGTAVQADVLITATGFRIGELPLAQSLYGLDGRTLGAVWDGEPQAYLGTTVTGFPNLFLLLGPNLLGGSTSAITVLEAQLSYLTAALAQLDRRGRQALEIDAATQAAHNAAVQEALRTTVYNSGGCSSYYFSPSGRNTFAWPWSTGQLVRQLGHFDPAAYNWHTATGPAPLPAVALPAVTLPAVTLPAPGKAPDDNRTAPARGEPR